MDTEVKKVELHYSDYMRSCNVSGGGGGDGGGGDAGGGGE